ncbi:hypothetical protein MMC28_000083 [Mycoblastus sanguinarius]|nr:hypothetical protein [Mycoblastus sanguinarius]
MSPHPPQTSLFSDLAIFYNSTTDFGSGIKSRLSNTTGLVCDGDKIFTTELPTELQNTSANVGLISYSSPSPPNSQARIYCDTVTHLTFPIYSLDTSINSNVLRLIQLHNLPLTANHTALVVSPDWFLATGPWTATARWTDSPDY